MSEHDKALPTSITGNRTSTPLLDTHQVNTNSLIVGSVEINGVSTNPNSTDANKLATISAVNEVKQEAKSLIRDVERSIQGIDVVPVISEAIIPPYFAVDSVWVNSNMKYSNGQAYFRNEIDSTFDNQASLKLNTDAFVQLGTYYIRIEVPTLQSGNLVLMDYKGDTLLTITEAGVHETRFTIEDLNVATYLLLVNQVAPYDRIVIDRIYIYLITERCDQYFDFIAKTIAAGDGSPLASQLWTTELMNNTVDDLKSEIIDNRIAHIDNMFNTHMSSSNPHGTTYNDVGASPRGHHHLPTECGAASTIHEHTPDECGAAPITHTHTPNECGAAATIHEHEPEDCKAAPTIHTHILSEITDSTDIVRHLTAKNNPHGTTKEDIALGNIQNYDIADLQAFKDRSSKHYTTPESIAEYLDVVFSADPALKYTQLAPKKILEQEVVLEEDQIFPLALRKDSVYEIYLDCTRKCNANALGMYMKEVGRNVDRYHNSWTLANYNTGSMYWYADTSNMLYFTPKDVGNNILRMNLRIETTHCTFNGTGAAFIGEVSVFDEVPKLITNDAYPITFHGSLKTLGDGAIQLNQIYNPSLYFMLDFNRLSKTPSVRYAEFNIVVYEFVESTTEAITIDRVPLLSRQKYLGSVAPAGWSIEDGSTLSIDQYAELAALIDSRQLVISSDEYTTKMNEDGYCPYFTVNSDKITLPTMPCTDEGSISIIKTTNSYVKGD